MNVFHGNSIIRVNKSLLAAAAVIIYSFSSFGQQGVMNVGGGTQVIDTI